MKKDRDYGYCVCGHWFNEHHKSTLACVANEGWDCHCMKFRKIGEKK